MNAPTKPQLYRDFIDHLVEMCRHGQGQIAARRITAGSWNQNASANDFADQHRVNSLLAKLGAADRQALAQLMSAEVELGVFETLKALERFGIGPFESGYEGSSFNDFIGRLNGWAWPES